MGILWELNPSKMHENLRKPHFINEHPWILIPKDKSFPKTKKRRGGEGHRSVPLGKAKAFVNPQAPALVEFQQNSGPGC